MGTEGSEAPRCPVSGGSPGQGQLCWLWLCASHCFSMMLGTLGLWALLPATVQGKCLQGEQGLSIYLLRKEAFEAAATPLEEW